MIRHPPRSPLFPCTPLFLSAVSGTTRDFGCGSSAPTTPAVGTSPIRGGRRLESACKTMPPMLPTPSHIIDQKSTRLNSSHGYISYAVFCLKKKKQNNRQSQN